MKMYRKRGRDRQREKVLHIRLLRHGEVSAHGFIHAFGELKMWRPHYSGALLFSTVCTAIDIATVASSPYSVTSSDALDYLWPLFHSNLFPPSRSSNVGLTTNPNHGVD